MTVASVRELVYHYLNAQCISYDGKREREREREKSVCFKRVGKSSEEDFIEKAREKKLSLPSPRRN